jgi:hypothetical protein
MMQEDTKVAEKHSLHFMMPRRKVAQDFTDIKAYISLFLGLILKST